MPFFADLGCNCIKIPVKKMHTMDQLYSCYGVQGSEVKQLAMDHHGEIHGLS